MRIRLNGNPVTLVAAACLLTALLALVPLMTVSLVHGNLSALAFGGILILGAASCVTGIASWALGLATSAGQRRWDWFVAVLLLGAPAALAFGLASSKTSAQ